MPLSVWSDYADDYNTRNWAEVEPEPDEELEEFFAGLYCEEDSTMSEDEAEAMFAYFEAMPGSVREYVA